MKKWIVGVASILVLFLLSSYFFIPRKLVVTKSVTVNANPAGAYRFLNDESNWPKWWPASSSVFNSPDTLFDSGGYRFRKNKMLYNGFEIIIEKDKVIQSSLLNVIPLGNDSTKIVWNTTVNTGTNPFRKIHYYFTVGELSKSQDAILTAMQKYISVAKNIYGLDIRKEKIQIESMVSTKTSFSHYPTTENIYTIMGQIRKYMAKVQAIETNYPVLNITARDSTHFELVVAIPVDKEVPDSGIFKKLRMPKNGYSLVTEVTGGKKTVDFALKQIDTYADDHQYLNIALPFQSFLTDRMKVADTSKWKTRIGYPVL